MVEGGPSPLNCHFYQGEQLRETSLLSLGTGGKKPWIGLCALRTARSGNLQPPDYHGNPISEEGSLVITEWRRDLCDAIYRSSGLTTTAILIRDMRLGLAGEFCEVFISSKPHLEPTA
jgi:hypothetical protein